MDLGRIKRLLKAVAAILAAAAVLFGILVGINAEWGFKGCTGTGAFGWIMAIVAGLLIGGVAWFLLFKTPSYANGEGESRHSIPCPSCEKAVMLGWRLCPYCGDVLPLEDAPAEAS